MFDLSSNVTIWHYAIPLLFIALDIITGFIKAWGNFSSVKMREGLKHKAGFILVLVLGSLIDFSQQFIDFGFEFPVMLVLAGVYVSLTEIVSIFENICDMNSDIRNSKFAKVILGIVDSADDSETQTDKETENV